ncbi:hypothetical protein ABZ442_05205 [Streptomyces triculaminicus]|uniref:hypothetical protein n=1 Tax=Streptomyces triculaminicus TaxID=2816232 RepID=UPI0033D4712D
MPLLPGGVTAIFDDQDDGLVIWVQEDAMPEWAAASLEDLFSVAVHYWRRLPADDRRLRAV